MYFMYVCMQQVISILIGYVDSVISSFKTEQFQFPSFAKPFNYYVSISKFRLYNDTQIPYSSYVS